ncbi:conidial yellow pigment biosynthesis polyketide synthase [Clohesyomyces aquaticus]|uniref:Conidial yellow pigment biosynthesis polyketide synthase n=1 Tax=Clohesyomyces aquaticus TaxID=1231657 RepID=A0A1Y1Z525_9PLEO|nr:conidial yellow pigment biosynthesis polyketide synthase [Clohesyomyces aquaticus]
MGSTHPTVLLFGDITDTWVDGMDYVFGQATTTAWLRSFLDDLFSACKAEIRGMDSFLQESFGACSNFQELAQKYRYSSDQVGLVHAMLLYTVRAVLLLETANREPLLLHPGEDGRPETHLVGISGGLWNAVAVPISTNFNTLYDSSIETGRVWVRLWGLIFTRSRAREDRPGAWGWAVLGIAADELEKILEQFQHSMGVPSSKRAKVGFVGDRWNTIIGPPSVLELLFSQCPELKKLPKNELAGIRGLQHTLEASAADIDYVVGNSTLLETQLRPGFKVWGMTSHNANTTYSSWGHLLRVAALQTLSQRLDLVQMVGELNAYLGTSQHVDVKMMGPSGHATYIVGVLKATRHVTVTDDRQSSSEGGGEGVREGAIAIVGMSGKGPGSEDMDEFWKVIVTGQDCHQEIPADRMDLDEYFCAKHSPGKCTITCRHGCFMKSPGHFDAKFFHISPREALLMEPVHRHFLMSAYEALEMAGYSAGQTRTTDPNKTAVFFAQSFDDWLKVSHHALGCDAYTLQSIQRAFGPGRLAFLMNWEGPTYALDSACAGSTSAIHLACMSLLSRDVDMAVAGATTILSDPHSFVFLSKAGVLSETGNCKTYRDDADGYCRADFSGALVLKRLEDAIAHNDNILAVVASSARNHSGNATSITTSDANAQERLFKKVLRNARLSPDEVSYIEMHGTGTQVGDKAEMGAVSKVFLPRPHGKPLPVGAIKANIGHSEAAAGMSSVLKSAGMPHAMNPNVLEILGDNSGIVIPTKPTEFKAADGKPKRILINNFDAAGGNASVLIEEYKQDPAGLARQREPDARSSHVITTSARTPSSHLANMRRLAAWLRANPNARIQDVAYSTTARKVHHPIRFALAAPTLQDAVSKLEAGIQRTASSTKKSAPPPVVFVFTGQGSHYAGMGSELYRTSPVFRKTADLCAAICASHQFPPFLDIITTDAVDMSTKNAAQVQLAVVTLQIALTAFWRSSAGIEAAMVIGHSLGEYAALHAAGVLSLTDTLYLVGQRARLLLERCEPNSYAMLSVSASATVVRDHLAGLEDSSCRVACINSPVATVISGKAEDLAGIQTNMTTQDANTRTKMLSVSFAFHSVQMDAILPDYKALASGVTYLPPKIPVASTLLASVVDVPGVFGEDYLAQQTRQAVDFYGALNAVRSALKNDDPFWLEIGPGPVCTSFVRATLSPPTTRINDSINANSSNWASVSKTLAAAYTSGIDVDWLALHAPYESSLELLALPTYAWDVKNYWITHTDKNSGALVPTAAAAAAANTVSSEPFLTTTAQYLVHKARTPEGQIQVTFRAGISDHGFMGVIDGHRMQQIGLASGTVFCDAAATVAKYALEYSGGKTGVTASHLTFHDPKLLAPLTRDLVGIDGDLLTTAIMESASADVVLATFKATSKSGESYDLGSVTVKYRSPDKAQADLDRVSFFIKAKMDERIRLSKEGSGHRMQPDVFFALFANAVEFSPDFRGVQEAYVAGDFQEAAATIKIRPDPTGTRFTSSPYWGEALLHLAGFMVNGNPNTPLQLTYALMGYASIEQLAPIQPDKEYLTYTRISRWEGTTAFCAAYVFDPLTSRIVMQALDLRYQQFKRTTWRYILGTKPHAAAAGPQDAISKSVSLPTAKETAMIHDKLSAASMATVPMKQQQASKAQDKDKEEGPLNTGEFQVILDSFATATGSDPSEFTDDTEIAEIGVDSIMAIEIVAAVREKGIDLPATFVFEYLTIGDLRRAFGGGVSEDADTNDSSATASRGDEDALLSSTPDEFSVSASPASSLVHVEKEDLSTLTPELVDSNMSPPPSVRITLLQGRPKAGNTPLYMMADGTGTVASFIHLRPFKSNQVVYGIDSPYLRCPSRMNSKVGIEGVAKLVVDALVKAHSTGPFMIGGYSVGCFVAFEISRQLARAGHTVKGLLLIDMPCPRSRVMDQGKLLAEAEVSEAVLEGIVNRDGQWSSFGSSRDHMRQFFVAMNEYTPMPMTAAERPAKTAIIWAERGLVNRMADDPARMQKLESQGVPTRPYPGFMEDPKLGTFACHVPDKGEENLGPNGWERYTGGHVMVLSVNGDHFELPMPGHVHILQAQMENALAYFSSD